MRRELQGILTRKINIMFTLSRDVPLYFPQDPDRSTTPDPAEHSPSGPPPPGLAGDAKDRI